MSLSEDAFSDSSTNSESSDDLTTEENISANSQRQHPIFSGRLPSFHVPPFVVNHPHGSMPIFSAGPSFHTKVQANHPRGTMPILSIGSTSRTRIRRPRGSMPIFSIGASSQTGVNHPRGSMPIVSAGSTSRIRSEVAQDSPSVGR
ncbi:hypothetical protein KY284_021191 [Solanum tuberosum]|nr:hypothetical protein KY284_021191 [Solanum tuberosum]